MKTLGIRELRANIGRLEELVAEEGELLISRRGQPVIPPKNGRGDKWNFVP